MNPSLAQLRSLARRDPVLGRALKRVPPFPGFPTPGKAGRPSHFAQLVSAVCNQKVSVKAAATIEARIRALTPGRNFPRPAEILALPRESLRSVGLTQVKTDAIIDLASRVEDRSLSLTRLARAENEVVIECLSEVRGLGEWSAQMFLIFRLGRLDVMPTGDLGVRKGLSVLDELDELPTPRALAERAEIWEPLRSVAAWVLWRLSADYVVPGSVGRA